MRLPSFSVAVALLSAPCANAASGEVVTAHADTPAAPTAVPAKEWVANCIAGMDKPEAAQPYLLMHEKPPTHEDNVKWCISQWNQMHPNQRIGHL